jgi:hypothetical protein
MRLVNHLKEGFPCTSFGKIEGFPDDGVDDAIRGACFASAKLTPTRQTDGKTGRAMRRDAPVRYVSPVATHYRFSASGTDWQ